MFNYWNVAIAPGASIIFRLWKLIWTSPNTLIGLLLGGLGVLTGGGAQRQRGCVEFYGGLVAWGLQRMPMTAGVLAMTLGHTILGQHRDGLELARDHEHVHVRQYERWGPFFLPAYLGVSAWLWLCRKDCYRGNPFEIEAYRISDPQLPIVEFDSES